MIEISIPNMIAVCIAFMAFGVNIEHIVIEIYEIVTQKEDE